MAINSPMSDSARLCPGPSRLPPVAQGWRSVLPFEGLRIRKVVVPFLAREGLAAIPSNQYPAAEPLKVFHAPLLPRLPENRQKQSRLILRARSGRYQTWCAFRQAYTSGPLESTKSNAASF
jgi:hypothetical protein